MPHHPVQKKIIRRPASAQTSHLPHLPPLLRRIYLARDLTDPAELERGLAKLPSP